MTKIADKREEEVGDEREKREEEYEADGSEFKPEVSCLPYLEIQLNVCVGNYERERKN